MELRGVDFGRVLCASGARNFFGDGWWYHRLWQWLGLRYDGSTFVSKTTTLLPRAGNMPLEGTRPKELFPACIKVKPWQGVVLNSVGLSGPGARELLGKGAWYEREEPFFLSFMSVESTVEKRVDEAREFATLLRSFMPFRAPIALQVNFSCPNVGLKSAVVLEMWKTLDVLQSLGIPLVPKINAMFPIEDVMSIEGHPAVDAISVSNTIPWGKLPALKPWEDLFGETSPLAHLGGGGLSGKPLLPLVLRWVQSARARGWEKPIIGGGGILSKKDASKMLDAGASAIELGSVSILRPWRVAGIIKHVRSR